MPIRPALHTLSPRVARVWEAFRSAWATPPHPRQMKSPWSTRPRWSTRPHSAHVLERVRGIDADQGAQGSSGDADRVTREQCETLLDRVGLPRRPRAPRWSRRAPASSRPQPSNPPAVDEEAASPSGGPGRCHHHAGPHVPEPVRALRRPAARRSDRGPARRAPRALGRCPHRSSAPIGRTCRRCRWGSRRTRSDVP